jgi:hypothetical protein
VEFKRALKLINKQLPGAGPTQQIFAYLEVWHPYLDSLPERCDAINALQKSYRDLGVPTGPVTRRFTKQDDVLSNGRNSKRYGCRRDGLGVVSVDIAIHSVHQDDSIGKGTMTKEEFDLIVESCKNVDRLQNTILESNMDSFSRSKFEKTKNLIINLTHHLDKTEEVYNTFLKEHKKRNGQNLVLW